MINQLARSSPRTGITDRLFEAHGPSIILRGTFAFHNPADLKVADLKVRKYLISVSQLSILYMFGQYHRKGCFDLMVHCLSFCLSVITRLSS